MCPFCPAIQDLLSSSESSQPSTPSGTAQRSDDASRATDGQYALLRPKTGLQQPNPNMPLPSASSSRPKPIFENGSVSDSGVAPRSHVSLGVSSAHKGRTSLLDVRHPSSSSPNLSLPGYLSDSGISDRSASPLHATRLDVKRLLSKPAAPSVVSALSIASDTDPEPHTLPRPLNSSEAWPSKARVQTQPRPRLVSSTMSRSESSEPEQSLPSPPPSLQQRPKVLRKKSTSGQHRTVMSAGPRSDTSNSSPLRSTHQAPAAGPSRGQRSNPLQSLIRSRAVVPTSAPTYGSGRLTPAGAIAQAYKEQDTRREALATTASADTMLPIIPVSASLLDAFEHATLEQKPHANVKSAPGDTRPGNSMDSFVLVDSAQEALCHDNEHFPSVPKSGDHSVSVSASRPAKSLTRKISAPLRHGLAAVNSAEARSGQGHGGEGMQTGHPRGNIDGGDLSQRKAKRKSKSLGLSLNTPLSSSGPEDVSVDRSGPPPLGESVPNSTNVLSQSKGKEKVQEKGDAGAGTRLWRLVKRISTGGLRERFQTASTLPPPVPTMPKDLSSLPKVQAPSESTSRGGGSDTSHGGDGGNGRMSHSIDSSDISPQSDGHLSTAASLPTEETHTSLQGNDAFSHPRRPSLSSSPQSSERTPSIHFFRTHSSRSSFSSVVATSPPPPPVLIRSPARSSSLQNRLRKKNDPSSSAAEIPTFSISDVVNNFVARRPSLARHQRRHAPTRSLPRIEPPPTGEVSGALLRRAGSEARSTTRRHRRFDPILSPVSSGQNRDSQGSDLTLRPAGSGTAGQCTFRELGGARGQAWTSQEKEDKWDDLLERSARAGGTLHLGVGSTHLASDDIRFSSGTLELET
jgi:hypothetical protein